MCSAQVGPRCYEIVVGAVAVGRFDHEPIGLRKLVRAADERLAGRAQVAAEDQPPGSVAFLDDQFHDRRAEDMPRLVEHGRGVLAQPHRLAVGDRFQQRQGPLDIMHGIKRFYREGAFAAFAAVPLLLEGRVFRLDLGRIAEQHLNQLAGRRGGQDLAVEAVGHELRQQPAMVDMGVCQQHEIEIAGADRRGEPVALLERAFLEHAAIDEHPRAVGVDVVSRPGDLPRRREIGASYSL